MSEDMKDKILKAKESLAKKDEKIAEVKGERTALDVAKEVAKDPEWEMALMLKACGFTMDILKKLKEEGKTVDEFTESCYRFVEEYEAKHGVIELGTSAKEDEKIAKGKGKPEKDEKIAKGKVGKTALELAMEVTSEEMIKTLIEKGADVNRTDDIKDIKHMLKGRDGR